MYGSWKVVGNAGALAVHAIPFINGLILFMSRPNNRNGSADDPYLTVNTVSRASSSHTEMLCSLPCLC